MLALGLITSETRVWTHGMADWGARDPPSPPPNMSL
jgi:hypothetical protein